MKKTAGVYIYIYIYRERERERETNGLSQRIPCRVQHESSSTDAPFLAAQEVSVPHVFSTQSRHCPYVQLY